MNKILSLFKPKQEKCLHTNVTIRTIHPVTLQPKTGICDSCGAFVRPKLTWESKYD